MEEQFSPGQQPVPGGQPPAGVPAPGYGFQAPGGGTSFTPASESIAAGPGAGPVPPVEPTPARRGRGLVVGAVAVVVAGLVGGGAYAVTALSGGGGDQPEQHMPGTVFAFAKADLEPSATQQVDAIQFMLRFPHSDKQAEALQNKSLREYVYRSLTANESDAPAWEDVKGWAGKRIAVGVMPGASSDQDPSAVIVLQVSDPDKARTALKKIAKDDQTGVAIKDGWALIAKTQAAADAAEATAESSPLSKVQRFHDDLSQLGESGFAAGWVDSAGAKTLMEKALSSQGSSLGSASMIGGMAAESLNQHGAFALRFADGHLELVSRISGGRAVAGTKQGTGIEKLPADTVAGMGIAGLGEALRSQWATMLPLLSMAGGSGGGDPVATIEQQTGLKLPDDLVTLLGDTTDVALAASGGTTPAMGLKVTSKDTQSAQVLEKVLALFGDKAAIVQHKATSDGFVLSTGVDQMNALENPSSTLGSTDQFKALVPDASSASMAVYLDLTKMSSEESLSSSMSDKDKKTLEALKGVGITASTDGKGTAQIRVRIG